MKSKKNLFISFILVMILAGTSALLFMQNKLLKNKTEFLQSQIIQQDELIDSVSQSGIAILLNSVFEKIDAELKDNPKRTLSDETIARITALSYSCKPYLRPEGDSLPGRKLSPERGQLLLVLSRMHLDSGSLQKILHQAIFTGANLREADLSNADLRKAKLDGADLKGAKLTGANLSEADLRSANFWGADLTQAKLMDADLTSADLSWANMDEVDMQRAKLNKATLPSTQMRKANLSGAFIQRADLSGALLNEANLTGADMLSIMMKRTILRSTNLTQTNLTTALMTEADLTDANLTNSNLSRANLTGVVVSNSDWFTILNTWNVTGAKEISERYMLVADSVKDFTQFRLEVKAK